MPVHHRIQQTTTPSRLSTSVSRHLAAGFTLIELIVGVLLLSIAAAGTVALFITAAEQSRNAATRNELQASIDDNQALVLQANDRYRCLNLAGVGSTCEVVNFDPNEDQYAPLPILAGANNPGFTRFLTLCSGNDLTQALIAQIDGLPQPLAPAAREPAVAETLNSGNPPHHRYQVSWTDADGNVVRRIVLYPTVAGWCPYP